MKKIHILESKLNEIRFDGHEFCAGTDTPYYEDEKTGEVYEASWNCDYGFPFGYWPIDYNGEMQFVIGDAWTTHANACGKCAEKYYYDVIGETLEDEANEISEAIENFIHWFKEYNYQYNEEDDNWVSEDGSEVKDVSDFIDEIREELYHEPIDCYGYIESFVENFLEGNETQAPYSTDVQQYLEDQMSEEYDFTERDDIDRALQEVGTDFYQFFERGHSEGRIWPNLEMIGFYVTEQPEPRAFEEILSNLSERLDIDYNELLQYHIVFEDWFHGDGYITACTVSDYIEGNYGPDEEDEEEDDTERQFARQGETVFVPHLANQKDKREFFKDFRDARDKAIFVPQERGAGTVARYHAMRYPYGESKKRNIDMKKIIRLTESDLHKIVKESVRRILEGDAWEKYPIEDRTEAELDANMNDKTNGEFANAYTRDDPMVKNVEGSTLRDMLKANMGNDIKGEV